MVLAVTLCLDAGRSLVFTISCSYLLFLAVIYYFLHRNKDGMHVMFLNFALLKAHAHMAAAVSNKS